jgi:hypothetical protein
LCSNCTSAQLFKIKFLGEVADITPDKSEWTIRLTTPIDVVGAEFKSKQSGSGKNIFIVSSGINTINIATDDTCKVLYSLSKAPEDINVGDIAEVFGYYMGNNKNKSNLMHYISINNYNNYIKNNNLVLSDFGLSKWGIDNKGNFGMEADLKGMNTPNDQPPRIIDITPDQQSPQGIDSAVTWFAKAFDPDNDPIYYQFWLRGPRTGEEWQIVQDWGTSNTWTWNAGKMDEGSSSIRVWIADGNNADYNNRDDSKEYKGYQIRSETIPSSKTEAVKGPTSSSSTNSNLPPSLVDLASDVFSPQSTGTTINWRATATDPENDPIYYKFWLRGSGTGGYWQAVQDWSTNSAWPWKTDEKDIGSSDVRVGTRDGNHADLENMDDFKESYDYEIIEGSNQPPSIVSLTPNLQGPQAVGSVVNWITAATDPENDPLYYKFWLNGPRTSGNWQMVQDWSTSSTWSWKIQDSDMGSSSVRVWVRDGKHAGTLDTDSFKEYNDYQIKSKELAQLNVQVTNDVYSENDRHLYYCQEGKYISFKNRIYLIGPDLGKVKSVKYVLHESFQENPAPDSEERANNFEMWIMTWGRFPIKALITTTNGQKFEKDYEFSFKSKVEEAQRRGIPMVRSCEG